MKLSAHSSGLSMVSADVLAEQVVDLGGVGDQAGLVGVEHRWVPFGQAAGGVPGTFWSGLLPARRRRWWRESSWMPSRRAMSESL